jgi:hypothetical protein
MMKMISLIADISFTFPSCLIALNAQGKIALHIIYLRNNFLNSFHLGYNFILQKLHALLNWNPLSYLTRAASQQQITGPRLLDNSAMHFGYR